jgi:hypothetical protein
LRDKSNPSMPVLNESKTAQKKVFDIAKDKAMNYGIWETDMRNEKPPVTPNVPNLGVVQAQGQQPMDINQQIVQHLEAQLK